MMPMHLDTAYINAIGDRQSNQDVLDSAFEDDLACFVLADGTGGHLGGETAANLVTASIIAKFRKDASFSAHALRSYIESAIQQVGQEKASSVRQENMSSTMATLLIDIANRCALWAHLGDTRIYLLRQGKILSVSKDHSLAQRMVDAGYADYAALRQHPHRNILFAAVGAEGDIVPEVTLDAVALQEGDAFLICTDGFWEWVHEDQMEQSWLASRSSEAWLKQMNAMAEKNIANTDVSRDNFSAFAICVRDASAL
jgi:serine/threonine protein phosphatase PrpC